MKKEQFLCDIKDCDCNATHKSFKLQVIFHTEQTEGRCVKPYLDSVNIDLCEKHMSEILEGNYVHANGAMGHNEYLLKNKID